MMNYEIFKEVVLQELPAYLKGPCAGREVVSFPTQKVNETLDGTMNLFWRQIRSGIIRRT